MRNKKRRERILSIKKNTRKKKRRDINTRKRRIDIIKRRERIR
jgi:hypothetical protein